MSKQIDLQLLRYQEKLRTKTEENKRYIYDPIRKKFLVLGPEEMVRQLTLCYLIDFKKYNKNRIRVEKGLKLNGLSKRCDILVYDMEMTPFLLVECKAPDVPITQSTFEQIGRYNLPLRVPYLMLTNGLTSFCCQVNYESQSFDFLDSIPDFPTLA